MRCSHHHDQHLQGMPEKKTAAANCRFGCLGLVAGEVALIAYACEIQGYGYAWLLMPVARHGGWPLHGYDTHAKLRCMLGLMPSASQTLHITKALRAFGDAKLHYAASQKGLSASGICINSISTKLAVLLEPLLLLLLLPDCCYQ